MNNPVVKSIEYHLLTGETLSFDASPITFENNDFTLKLEDNVLQFELKKEFSSVNQAREFIDTFLETWKVKAELNYGLHEINFEFVNAEVIDRNPPKPGEPKKISMETGHYVMVGEEVNFQITKKKYPEPPKNFNLSPTVRTLWERYQNYKTNRESIFSMAYFCYTVLTTQSGNLKDASIKYNISKSVLTHLRELSSTKGDETTARKFKAINPTSNLDINWLDQAVRAIISQVATINSDKEIKKLTMSDLPKIENN